MQFQMVGAPANVGSQGHRGAVVGSPWTLGCVGGERHAMGAHDAKHALGVHCRQSLRPQLAVRKNRDAAIAIGQAGVDDQPTSAAARRPFCGAASPAPRQGQTLGRVGSRHAQRLRQCGYGELSLPPFHEGNCQDCLVVRARSSGSFRISTAMVFRPSRRGDPYPLLKSTHLARPHYVLVRVDSLMAAFDHSPLPAEEQAWRETVTASNQQH